MTRRTALAAGLVLLAAALSYPEGAPQAQGRDTCLSRLAAEPLECIGTEPFWNLTLNAARAEFSQLGEKRQTWYASDCRYAENRHDTWFLPLRDLGSNRRGYAVVLEGIACNDGMSDRSYSFEVLLAAPDGTGLRGCCQLQPR